MTDNEMKPRHVSQCSTADWCRGYNEAVEKANEIINRQKAEIDRLEGEIDKQYEQAKADILGNMADGGTSCHWCIEQHKAEAVKEFVEQLYKKAKRHNNSEYHYVLADDITDLAKEMVGDAE